MFDDLQGCRMVLDAHIVVDEEFSHGQGYIHAGVVGCNFHVLEEVLDG